MRAIETPRLLEPFIARLGLQYQLHFVSSQLDSGTYTFRARREHIILLKEATVERIEMGDLSTGVHELGHAKLGETYSPLLAVNATHPTITHDPNFINEIEMLYVASQHIEVWVDDVTAQLDQRILENHMGRLLLTMDEMGAELLPEGEGHREYWKSAVILAEVAAALTRSSMPWLKNRYERVFRKVANIRGRPYEKVMRRLIGRYVSLPRLEKLIPEKIVKLHEKQTQAAVPVFGFPIRLYLVEHEGEDLWMIEGG